MKLRHFIFGVVLPEIEQKLEGVITGFEIVCIAPFGVLCFLWIILFVMPCQFLDFQIHTHSKIGIIKRD